jgi:hypothetical protein
MLSKQQFDADLEVVSKQSHKNDKLAWARKRKKLEEMVEELQPLESQILDLMAKKQVHLDEITALRMMMIRECIHPQESLVHHGTYIDCKFCGNKLGINKPSL